MKSQFGSCWSRLRWGGVKLSVVELGILEALVSGLPDELRPVAKQQFEASRSSFFECFCKAV